MVLCRIPAGTFNGVHPCFDAEAINLTAGEALADGFQIRSTIAAIPCPGDRTDEHASSGSLP